MFKKIKKDFLKKVKAAASNQQQPTMYNSISAFEQPPVAPMGIGNRAMYKKGGYMMGGSTMTETMQGQMKKKMTEPRGGYAHGGKAMGGKADIAAMEKACSAMAGKNKSVTY